MELRDGMFAVKLCELEHQYGLLRSRLELCQGADHEKIRHLLADVLDDYRENALLLEQSAEGLPLPGSGGAGGRPAGLLQTDGGAAAGQAAPPDARGRGPAGGVGRRQRPFSRSTPSTSRPRACAAPCWAALAAMDQQMNCEEQQGKEHPV